MAKALEKEFKFRLTAGELSRLKRAGKIRKTVKQTNHYFDVTPNLPFARNGIGIRIRNQDGKFLLTVKAPAAGAKRSKGFHVKQEWECVLPAAIAKNAIAGKIPLTAIQALPIRRLETHAKGLPLTKVHYLGAMKNVRAKVDFDALELELDCFTIKGKPFYEAECETEVPEATLAEIRALWKALRIPLRAEAASKLARFLAAYRRRS